MWRLFGELCWRTTTTGMDSSSFAIEFASGMHLIALSACYVSAAIPYSERTQLELVSMMQATFSHHFHEIICRQIAVLIIVSKRAESAIALSCQYDSDVVGKAKSGRFSGRIGRDSSQNRNKISNADCDDLILNANTHAHIRTKSVQSSQPSETGERKRIKIKMRSFSEARGISSNTFSRLCARRRSSVMVRTAV